MKENKRENKSENQENEGTSRRGFIAKTLFAGAGLAASSLALAASQSQASAQTGKRKNQRASNAKVATNPLIGRRRLGKLEVSSIGLGVQNMSRKYETTVPYRPEMINIIRAAYNRGVTFFDTAEAYGPFECERILGESIAPFRNIVPRFTPEARKANQALVDLLRAIGEKKNATPAQIALAWLLAQKPWIVPIPGTTKMHRLEENLGAAEIELTADDLREIDSAASKITVQGARYPEHLERRAGR